jgi:hypothetical protein
MATVVGAEAVITMSGGQMILVGVQASSLRRLDLRRLTGLRGAG